MAENEVKPKSLYVQVSGLVDVWLDLHQGETFDLELMCRQLEIVSREARQEAAKKLSYEVKKGKLEKFNSYNTSKYKYINTNTIVIDWVNANIEDTVNLFWPYGMEDNTHFGFDPHIIIPQKGIIVLAGVSNTGKTTFALNFLYTNMDEHPCTLMGSEYEASQLRRRLSFMKFADPLTEDGKPKFEVIDRHEDWKDIIRPDNINIIDWINLGDNFYQLGKVIEGIKGKLNKGIALICIQKDASKNLGMGGMWGAHLASLYLTMDFGRMTVEKAKEWNGHNPNKEIYGFEIIEHGSQFHNIRQVVLCRHCYGKTGNTKCQLCNGKGFVDKE